MKSCTWLLKKKSNVLLGAVIKEHQEGGRAWACSATWGPATWSIVLSPTFQKDRPNQEGERSDNVQGIGSVCSGEEKPLGKGTPLSCLI